MPLPAASMRRWFRALRVGWNALASSTAPISRIGCRIVPNRRPSKSVSPLPRSRSSISRMVVDFPAPLGPRKPVTMPGRTSNVRSSTATLAPYRLAKRVAVIIKAPKRRVVVSRVGRMAEGC